VVGAVRLRLIKFIGRIGGHLSLELLNGVHDNFNAALKLDGRMLWSSEGHLLFAFPFEDVKMDITLDFLVPHVASLAESASDRQAKVSFL
jgi:hypothetical protein